MSSLSSHQDDRGAPVEDAQRLRLALLRDWQTTFDAVADAVWLLDRDCRILRCNKASESFFKKDSGEIIGRHCWELTHNGSRPHEDCPFVRLQHSQQRESAELLVGERWCEVTVDPILDDTGTLVGGVHVTRDVTDRKRAEVRGQTIASILGMLNSANSLHALTEQVTAFLSHWSGCDAVGIRLREGENYPYYQTRGFSKELVLAENQLCAVDAEGMLIHDSQGSPVLECLCGSILHNRFDPSKPCFTKHGSFWTNSMTRLLTATPEADPLSCTRNHCNAEGFESVALIPLRCEGQTFGLLQFNDKREGRFTPELITFLETVADNLAVGLAHRRAAKARDDLAAFNRATLDGLSDHIAIVNQAGVIEAVNQAWRSFAVANGIREEAVCEGVNYLSVCEAVSGEDAEQAQGLARAAHEVLAGQRDGYELEYACHSPETQRWFVARVTRFPGDGPPRVVIAHEDITERVRREHEKAALEAQLQQAQKMEAVGRLAGGVAHGFNNLLIVIHGQAEAALNAIGHADGVRAAIESIQDAARQATEITRSLQMFSRQLPANKSRTDIHSIVDEAARLLRHFLPKAVSLEVVRTSPSPVWIDADRVQMIQVILNLAINARDAMPQGGVLRIAVANPPLFSNLAAGAGQLADRCWTQLSITDNGTGIPAELLTRIFEPFFTTKPHDQGTGLGLPVAQGIVESHGGFIDVQSELGCGTTFTLYLPCVSDTPGGPSLSTPPEGGGEVILLAAQDAYFRAMLASFLRSRGHEVVPANDENEALAKLRDQIGTIRLAIVDRDLAPSGANRFLGRVWQEKPGLPAIVLGEGPALDCSGGGEAVVLGGRFEMNQLADAVYASLAAHDRKERPL